MIAKISTKKPCIQCGNECDIMPIELGDSFTLTYLRVCGPECLFLMAYDYLHEIGEHKGFRCSLYGKQNDEDKALRDEFIETTTKMFHEDFRKNLEANPNLLSTPTPDFTSLFTDFVPIPRCSGETMRFARPSKEQKMKWARQNVERTLAKFHEAQKDLERLENE